VYFAAFVITHVNEEEKKKTADLLRQEYKTKKKQIEKEGQDQIKNANDKKLGAKDLEKIQEAARIAPIGAAGRWPFRVVGLERPIPPRNHPQQPPEAPARNQGAGGDSAERKTDVAGSCGLAVRQLA
jgi:hypothetical protein